MKRYNLWVEEIIGAETKVCYKIRGNYERDLPLFTFNTNMMISPQKSEKLTLCGKVLAGEIYKALKSSNGNDKIRINPGCDTGKTYDEKIRGNISVKLRTPSFEELQIIENGVRSELKTLLLAAPINENAIESRLYPGNWYFL
jgi:hypothetical protein